ncbi:14218_t:CDS:2 [Funneliformis mosseae]|uniref:14218_t:CDS:1 n=1 Tax=Funneliformis mosseae TaxID=27381 RepID=A0A9N8YLI0_FUNMO|nr:14218_t:CDS:2 [Funneliformis mosseae]
MLLNDCSLDVKTFCDAIDTRYSKYKIQVTIIDEFYLPILLVIFVSLVYNLFITEKLRHLSSSESQNDAPNALEIQQFLNQFMGLLTLYNNHLDLILLVGWSIIVFSNNHVLFRSWEVVRYESSVYNIAYITKRYDNNDNSLRGDVDCEAQPLLDEYIETIDIMDAEEIDVNAKLIDVGEEESVCQSN